MAQTASVSTDFPQRLRIVFQAPSSVNAVDDHFNDSPLLTAAEHDKVEAVAALLEAGAEVNHQDVIGSTPLHGAAFRDRIEMVQMLLDAGSDPTIADHKGQTPLDVARTRAPAIAKLLEQAASSRQASNLQGIP